MDYIIIDGSKIEGWQMKLHSKPELLNLKKFRIDENFTEKSSFCTCENHKTHFDCLDRLRTHWKSKPEKRYDNSIDSGCKFAEFMDIIVLNRRKSKSLQDLKNFLNENIEILRWLDWRHLHCIVQSFNDLSRDTEELAICAVIDSFHMFQKFGNYFSGNEKGVACSGYRFRGGEFFRKKICYIINILSKNELLFKVFCAANAWNVLYENTVMHKVAVRLAHQRRQGEWNSYKQLFINY
jgi:hypothetical protein